MTNTHFDDDGSKSKDRFYFGFRVKVVRVKRTLQNAIVFELWNKEKGRWHLHRKLTHFSSTMCCVFSFHDNISSVDTGAQPTVSTLFLSFLMAELVVCHLSGTRLNVQNSGSCQEILDSLNCHFWLCFGFTLEVQWRPISYEEFKKMWWTVRNENINQTLSTCRIKSCASLVKVNLHHNYIFWPI